MEKKFFSVDDVLADEGYLAWFFKESGESIEAWEQWINAHPEYKPMVEEANHLMFHLQALESEISEKQKLSALDQLNRSIDDLSRNTPVFQINRSGRRKWIVAAAAAVVIIATATFFLKFSSHKTTISTSYGQLAQQILPDGSEVMLNANSAVRLEKTWSDGTDREVWLQGEAFFHVTKTSAHTRFIVHTDQLDVIVTGTKFNVVSRFDRTSVLLTEGSVTIKTKEGKEINMKPGQFVDIQNNEIEQTSGHQEAVLAWKDSNILFDKTPMAEVARIITEHYGIKVKLTEDSSNMKPVSGLMNNNNLDVLLKALEATGNYKIVRTSDEIIISNP